MMLLPFAARMLALAALTCLPAAFSPAAAASGDVYVHAGPNFKPVSIAVTPFAGDDGADKIGSVVANDFARSIFLLPLNAIGLSRERRPIRTSDPTSTRGRTPTRNSC